MNRLYYTVDCPVCEYRRRPQVMKSAEITRRVHETAFGHRAEILLSGPPSGMSIFKKAGQRLAQDAADRDADGHRIANGHGLSHLLT